MYVIYTDGACKSSNKTGGWAFVVIKDDKKIYFDFNSEDDTTNNRMEITACIKALEYCIDNNIKEVVIQTDSMYVIGTMKYGWKRNANNDLRHGRLLTLYKEMNDFEEIEVSIQDDGKTLKIFLK